MPADAKDGARRWFGLTAAVVLGFWLLVLARPGAMNAWGVSPLSPRFADTFAILAAGEAAHAGINVYAGNPLDPLNRPHVYGPWWLATGWVGLDRGDVWWVGLLLDAAALAVALRLLAPRDARSAAVSVLLLASPPMILALERANNDLAMLILAVAACWCLGRSGRAASAGAAALLVVAAALKIYPLFALPALGARATSKRRALGLVGLALLAIAMIAALQGTEFRRTLALAPAPVTIFAYGAGLTVKILRWLDGPRWWIGLGIGLTAAVLVWRGRRRWRDAWSLLPETGAMTAAYVTGALAWGGCYLLTSSFPYRFILLLLPAGCLLRRLDAPAAGRVAAGQLAMITVLCWLTCLKGHLFAPVADGQTLTGSALAWLVLGVELALAAGMFLTLALTVLGWAVRRLQGAEA